MDDLISRRDAIYAIEKRMDDITCEEFAEGLSEAITEISLLPSAQQWIPCSERLPEIGQTVITSSDLGRVREATYKGFDAWTIHGVVHWTDEILSWMPLPEPYKGEE